jgi:MYXO-CTERM domain-containing protein
MFGKKTQVWCAAAIGSLALSTAAQAGYVISGGISDPATITGTPGGSGGSTIQITAGTLWGIVPDDVSTDIQVTGGDVDRYGYTLDLTNSSGTDLYTGSYRFFYDVNDNNVFDSGTDLTTSAGDASLNIIVNPYESSGKQWYATNGSLHQTAGPDNPAFGDLSYGGHDLELNSANFTLDYPVAGQSIARTLSFRQTATRVPEPSGMGLAGLAGLALLARRSRRRIA